MEERTTSSTGGQKGVKLERHDLIPAGSLAKLAEHFGKGARKYEGDHQWRKGYEWSKSYSALQRHLMAFWSGLDYDVCSNDPQGCSFVTASGEEYIPLEVDTCYNHTGSHHMTAVAWHAFVLLEFAETHPDHDDRYKINPLESFNLNEYAFSREEILANVDVGNLTSMTSVVRAQDQEDLTPEDIFEMDDEAFFKLDPWRLSLKPLSAWYHSREDRNKPN